MKLIVGLGNPGRKYANTRHNVGFKVIKILAKRNNFAKPEDCCRALISQGSIAQKEIILAQPLTFMNRSGRAVSCLLREHNLSEADLLLIYDDLNLELGQLRLRLSGSSGGHNGMKSIIDNLGTDEFARLRIGIGNPLPGIDASGYVLEEFSSEEKEIIESSLKEAARAVEVYLEKGPKATMNKFN